MRRTPSGSNPEKMTTTETPRSRAERAASTCTNDLESTHTHANTHTDTTTQHTRTHPHTTDTHDT